MRRLWCHGKVDSMARPMRRCEAVGVENETIVFLGTDQEALTQNWDEIIDLEGRQMLPASRTPTCICSTMCCFRRIWPCLGWTPSSPSSVWAGERIAQNHPACLLGMGWNQEHLAEGRMPERRDLDRISTEIPICLLRGVRPHRRLQHRHGGAADRDSGPGAPGGVGEGGCGARLPPGGGHAPLYGNHPPGRATRRSGI